MDRKALTNSEAPFDSFAFENDDMCKMCKSSHKFDDLNMCIVVDWCRNNSSFKYFRKERQKQNASDCKNFLDEECINYLRSLPKDNHEKCENCHHFSCKELSE